MNIVALTGRLTKDPEMGQTKNGKVFCNFHLAVPGRSTDTVNFPLVQVWGQNAEFVKKYFKKGSKIEIDGEITTQMYKNQNGDPVYSQRVVATRVHFAESKSSFAAWQEKEGGDDAFKNEQTLPTTTIGRATPETPTKPAEEKSIEELADDFMAIPDDTSSEIPFI